MTLPLDIAGRQLRSARERLERAMETARESAIAADDAGTSESEIARTLGVDRMTVRKWKGKR